MPRTLYLHAHGRKIAQVKDGVRTDYLTDALGSITATKNQSQAIVNTYRWKPYGGMLARTGLEADDPKYGWTGDTGSRITKTNWVNQYNVFRHYGSQQAAWTTVDPLWPREWAYGYVRGAPVRRIDPSGMSSCGDPRNNSCKYPERNQVGCCMPIIFCSEQLSRARFTMPLYADARTAGNASTYQIGQLSVTIAYIIQYVPIPPYVGACPPPEIVQASTSVTATSGKKDLQYPWGWNVQNGPIMPSTFRVWGVPVITYDYRLYTQCHPGDASGMEIPPEHFKFRIGTATNTNPTWENGRSRFLVHPDGGLNSSWGCIVTQSAAGSKNFRSCMHWAQEKGCSRIPLTVSYT